MVYPYTGVVSVVVYPCAGAASSWNVYTCSDREIAIERRIVEILVGRVLV